MSRLKYGATKQKASDDRMRLSITSRGSHRRCATPIATIGQTAVKVTPCSSGAGRRPSRI